MSASDVITASANVATAFGVIGVGAQLLLNRREMVFAFERTFTARYEATIRGVPLEVLLGGDFDVNEHSDTLRHFFDYFELCEEQMYYRQVGKISNNTWRDWWEGMNLHLRRPGFQAAWKHLDKAAVAPASGALIRVEQFAILRKAVLAVETGQWFDPKSFRSP